MRQANAERPVCMRPWRVKNSANTGIRDGPRPGTECPECGTADRSNAPPRLSLPPPHIWRSLWVWAHHSAQISLTLPSPSI